MIPDNEEIAALELVDAIDRHQAIQAEYHPDHQPAEPDPPHCRECNELWPCWTVRIVHHAHALGVTAGHIDAARFLFPGNPGRRLIVMVMTPESDVPPWPSLDPVEALHNPTVTP